MYKTMSSRIKRIVMDLFDGNRSEFARKVGISESGVRSYLAGTIPKVDVLEKITNSLGISCEWLVLGRGELFTCSIRNKDVLDDAVMVDKLLAIIKVKDDRIEELSRTIGRLEIELKMLNS